MKIALFSDTFPPQVNGVAHTLKKLIHYMDGCGISHQVFVPGPGEQEEPGEKIKRLVSMPLAFYPDCRMALPRYFFIRNQLQQFQPDLIHVATPFNIGLCGHFYGNKYHIPLVASYHTHFDRYLRYYGLPFAVGIFWRFIRWFHSSCQATLVPSEETRQHLKNQGVERIALWQRGIDAHQFHPDKRSSSIRTRYGITKPYIVLYAGRMAPEKDIDILKETMEKLPHPLSNQLHWILAGDGPLLQEFKNQFPSHVTFTGFLPQEQLAEIYASSDLFFFPSSTETFGNVVLEAMSAGLPVIGANAGGVKELIKHGETGMLCQPRDVASFLSALESIFSDPPLRETMGKAARRFALSQSWDKIFDNLFALYEKVIFLSHKIPGKNIFSA